MTAFRLRPAFSSTPPLSRALVSNRSIDRPLDGCREMWHETLFSRRRLVPGKSFASCLRLCKKRSAFSHYAPARWRRRRHCADRIAPMRRPRSLPIAVERKPWRGMDELSFFLKETKTKARPSFLNKNKSSSVLLKRKAKARPSPSKACTQQRWEASGIAASARCRPRNAVRAMPPPALPPRCILGEC